MYDVIHTYKLQTLTSVHIRHIPYEQHNCNSERNNDRVTSTTRNNVLVATPISVAIVPREVSENRNILF